MAACAILFPNDDFVDVTGCVKEHGHDGDHICTTKDGRTIAWEVDYGCTCGCHELEESCINYREINKD